MSSPQHSLPPCHPIARVSTHSRAVLPSHDTFFTVDESHEHGMACVEVTPTRTRTHAHTPQPPTPCPSLASSSRRTTASCSGSVCDARARPDLRQHLTAPATLPDSVSHYYGRLRPMYYIMTLRLALAHKAQSLTAPCLMCCMRKEQRGRTVLVLPDGFKSVSY